MMLTIYKLRADCVFDFAAEELKKYLRMMLPDAGDVGILYDPNAKEGFRLGFLEDFGLENEAEDPVLDDVVRVEADKNGGILAGSNSRSVLFAVYRFFKENGCRWLYPGIDGEWTPLKDIEPVSYHKMASHRFRGHCNEGSESQSAMLETIDFYAKQELNVYMLEFEYMEGEKSKDPARGNYYDPERVARLSHVAELCAEGRALAKKMPENPSRPQVISRRLLHYHTIFCALLCKIVTAKAKGDDEKAFALAEKFQIEMGKNELPVDLYYDHGLDPEWSISS